MTGGRFEPNRVAETHDQDPLQEPAATCADEAEPWEDSEAWDYDEARANPEAYDQLEYRLMSERERPRFTRFRAAMADFPEVAADIELLPDPTIEDHASWLQAVRTGRFWSNAIWLTGAACAGVLAGLVSTNIVALALNPEASTLFASQLTSSSPAVSAPAPSSLTAMADVAARAQAPARPDAKLPTTPAAGLTNPTRPQPAANQLETRRAALTPAARTTEPAAPPMTPRQVAAVVEPEAVRPEMAPEAAAPSRPATGPAPTGREVLPDADLSSTLPTAVVQLAALVEPAPGLPEPARRAPAAAAAPPTAAAPPPLAPAETPADRAIAPTPPPAATEARAVPPPAPTIEYRVQLAMLRDETNAKYVWHDFVAQFGPGAKALHRYVLPTQTAHGTRHLLQVGPFGDEDHAEAMCNRLKQRGGDCLVVRQPS